MVTVKVMNFKIIIILFFNMLQVIYSDWASDWMQPLQDELSKPHIFSHSIEQVHDNKTSNENLESRLMEEEEKSMSVTKDFEEPSTVIYDTKYQNLGPMVNTAELRQDLEDNLRSANKLAETLRIQIEEITLREKVIKEAIVNGRSGISTVTVLSTSRGPRSYLIRDGFWSLCNGLIQYPVIQQTEATNLFEELFVAPKCIGEEMSVTKDKCVFNSVTKYQTLPTRRKAEYSEDQYFCLKNGFNNTLDHYFSVPRKVVNNTCQSGVVRSLDSNIQECGLRVMSEYTYYPHRSSSAALLPLEYCTEADGACKLIMAWHISNTTVENFEFLKNERHFKKYFIKTGPFVSMKS